MADTKITALTALTAADPINDVIPIVDVSDTSMAASGTTKKISVNNILSSSPTASGALTVTGLVTAGSATITGAATVGTTLGVTGNLTVQTNKLAVTTTGVGCGIATPSNQLHVKSTSSTPALIETSGGALTYLQFTSTTGSAYIGNNANGLGFYTTGSADLRMSLAAAGDLSITSGNVVMGTSGKGIDFGVTTPDGTGTMTSELLDDYEEGTWTPAYSPTTGAFTTLPTVGSGKYRKIGDTVFFSIAIKTAGTVVLGAASGDIQITGFPFTCSAAGGNGTSSLFQQFNLAVSSAHLGISITGSTTIATITKNLSNGSVTYVQANELSTATGNFENLIYAFGMYNV